MFERLTLTLLLLQQTSVYLVIAYLLSRTLLFMPLMNVTIRPSHKLAAYVMFSMFCIMGTYFGLQIDDSIANTRAIGAVLGGIFGGPSVGLAVGLTGGLHRYTLGGPTALACAISTVAEGLIGGMVHRHFVGRGQIERLFDPWRIALVAFLAEVTQMAIILLVTQPFEVAWKVVDHVALPMWISNTIGAGLFMRILAERRVLLERQSSVFSAKALKIAARAEGIFRNGFNRETTMRISRIIYEETGVGAVAITDRDRILAFIGIGDDHHLPGTPISSDLTRQAIEHNRVMYADGNEVPYQCSISPTCRLGASLVIPLLGEDERVIGTIKLYEPRTRLVSSINRSLGEGLARLFSTQILAGRYEQQKQLLAQSEIKLLHAQINPHFLFNTLNVLSSVIRTDPERARQLVLNLSTFFRKNLKRPTEEASLGDEIEHVNAYLQIELARFAGRLKVEIDVPEALRHVRMPAFSLQPIVENAIKHGTSQLLEPGVVRIRAEQVGDELLLSVEDNAGLFDGDAKGGEGPGLGMSLVDRRLRNRYGEGYGVEVACERDISTQVILRLPMQMAAV
ncbi:high-affinity pyruvate receptor [Rhodovastum atsumiense]|uniref:histidine kinase n=1 Tax=Rhodovastum atsumiense TaxID=504468 RepID=A0A5M6IXC3_9PROT|nr:sensor histidine kinase [Rhodovastum atsumiense]KAA5612629.1 sensor histidine kinase [Rhodovastum atsumiense]CAH2601268.1 high-affinity pyruvate receptor [Rhodovastum atsumiense]